MELLKEEVGERRISQGRAIKIHCKGCCGDQQVEGCEIPDCVLYPFRLGKNPYRTKRVMSEEQKAILRERGFGKRK